MPVTMLAIKTPVFEGPLDLLLHLIERNDLDVTAVSLVQVTDQYMSALRGPECIDMRALADFVAVGARLLLLKSRALLPRTAEQAQADALEAEEIAADLTAQLEEYRVYKNAAYYFRGLEEAGHRSFVRIAPPPAGFLPTGLERVTMDKLLRALSRALERLPVMPPPERLARPSMNITERRASVLSHIQHRGRVTFTRLVTECRTRFECVVTFLAVLELLKTEDVVAEQDGPFGEIVLQPREQKPTETRRLEAVTAWLSFQVSAEPRDAPDPQRCAD
jgi:segregation and condensation protein A